MERKIIFIDVDGPLAWGSWDGDKVPLNKGFTNEFSIPYLWVNEDCAALKNILDATGAEMVLSSDWKRHFSFNQMRQIFAYHGISGNYLIDTTTHQTLWKKMGRCPENWERASQIIKWVKDNKPTHWIAIDDLRISSDFKWMKIPQWRHVWVDGHHGEGNRLRDKVDECITKLSR